MSKKTKTKVVCVNEDCIYCNEPLLDQHEHDHFPTAFRHGGESCFCVCSGCHTLKDRMIIDNFNSSTVFSSFSNIWSKSDRYERILMAKICHLLMDYNEQKITHP